MRGRSIIKVKFQQSMKIVLDAENASLSKIPDASFCEMGNLSRFLPKQGHKWWQQSSTTSRICYPNQFEESQALVTAFPGHKKTRTSSNSSSTPGRSEGLDCSPSHVTATISSFLTSNLKVTNGMM